MGLSRYTVTAIKISLSALLLTHTKDAAALATLPYAYFSSPPPFKTSSLTKRSALSKAEEPLSPAVAEAFRDCHLHMTAALQRTPGTGLYQHLRVTARSMATTSNS